MVPLGTKAIIFVTTKDRLTWDYHATEGFYLGPAMDHYRCHRIYIKETRGERTSDTIQFLPTHCKMPYASSIDEVLAALKNLVAAISKAKPDSPFSLKDDEVESIKKLAKMFKPRSTPENTIEPSESLTAVESPRVESTAATPLRVEPTAATPPRVMPPNTRPTQSVIGQTQPTNNYPSPHHTSHRPLVTHRYPTRSRGSVQANATHKQKKSVTFNTNENILHIIPARGKNHHIKLDKQIIQLRRAITSSIKRRLPSKVNAYLCALHEKTTSTTRSFTKESATAVLCETTGKLLEYRHLLKTDANDLWSKSFSNELGCLAQGNSRV